jgi:hypothetical protein
MFMTNSKTNPCPPLHRNYATGPLSAKKSPRVFLGVTQLNRALFSQPANITGAGRQLLCLAPLGTPRANTFARVFWRVGARKVR